MNPQQIHRRKRHSNIAQNQLLLLAQASLGVRSSLWSYNPLLTAWEPVIEPWGVLLKLDSNRGHEVSKGYCAFAAAQLVLIDCWAYGACRRAILPERILIMSAC